MSDSEHDWVFRETARWTQMTGGDVPPPWVFSPDSHPYSIDWRMGSGEGYLMVFGHWWESQRFDEAACIAYFRKYPPPPRWLRWMIDAIWDIPEDDGEDEPDYAPYFERVEQLGFGSKTDFERDLDDSRWLTM